jgi:hypothetical protein
MKTCVIESSIPEQNTTKGGKGGRDQILDIKVWQIYPLFKGLNHIQGLDTDLGFTYICGW